MVPKTYVISNLQINIIKKKDFLVVQWLRVCLAMQGIQV